MSDAALSRAQFLARAAAAAAVPTLAACAADDSPSTTGTSGRRPGLTYRGITYEVADGGTPATSWTAARMREDMRTIREQLHANSVSVFGTGVERLAATASEAAERGLHVWLQPRLADRPPAEILDHLAAAGEQAQELRRQGAGVHLSVGAEFLLFVPGIVPGDGAVERIRNLTAGRVDRRQLRQRLTDFIADSARVGRRVFDGELTYGAADGDVVDWTLFDIVSVNYYSSLPRRADYVRELEPYRRWGKPVAISEFGACPYVGAPKLGGMAWDVVDYEQSPPQIVGDLQRSEETQARYLVRLLDVFESMGLYAAMVYNFVAADSPYDRDPRYDIDLASYGVVKAVWEARGVPTDDWHWEPKQAFYALARAYAEAEAGG